MACAWLNNEVQRAWLTTARVLRAWACCVRERAAYFMVLYLECPPYHRRVRCLVLLNQRFGGEGEDQGRDHRQHRGSFAQVLGRRN